MQVSALTYYCTFGSPMPTRSWNDPNAKYKYGFNGKEKDNEVNVDGGDYDYGARIYDSRLGRWLSLDPLQAKFSNVSAYNFSLNTPIMMKDPDGKSAVVSINAAGEVTITAHFVLYGSATGKLTADDIAHFAQNIELMLNAAMTEYMAANDGGIVIDGVKRTSVNFNISAEVMDETLAKTALSSNTDFKNNYYSVEEGGSVSSAEFNSEDKVDNENKPYKDNLGGNTGRLRLSDLTDKGKSTIGLLLSQPQLDLCASNKSICPQPIVSTTALHEFMHGLGLLNKADGGVQGFHLPNPTDEQLKAKGGIANIMNARSSTVNTFDRRPDSTTIKALNFTNLTFTAKNDGTKVATLGQLTKNPKALR